ncbi:MAG: SurA N-terminal domain-containing protein [Oceanidesulfovibrio sp.]
MRKFIVSMFIATLAWSVAAPAGAAQVVDGIAAVVNGEIITIGDLDKEIDERLAETEVPEGYSMEEIRQRGREMLLESMINDILIQQEAERLGLDVSQVDIENAIRKIREEKGMTVEEFRNQLALRNMTREDYSEVIRNELLKQRLIGYMVHHRVAVTDKELAEYVSRARTSANMNVGMDQYGLEEMKHMMGEMAQGDAPAQSQKKQAASSSRVSLSIIVLGTKGDAEKLRGEVVSGARDFAAAAKQFSQGPGADAGGSLGEMALSELGAPIRKAVASISPGEVSEVFELAGQYAFVKLKGGGGPAVASPSEPAPKPEPAEAAENTEPEPSPESVLSELSDDQAEQLRERLHKKKLEERFKEYIQQLRDKAVIRVNL